MKLTGSQTRKLHEALLSAFPTMAGLEQFLKFRMNTSLRVIAGGENLAEIVFNLIRWAESTGKMDDLIKCSIQEVPNNPLLSEFHDAFFALIEETGESPQSSRNVNTGGGAYIGGNVHISGGDFVGGDKISTNIVGNGNVVGSHNIVIGNMASGTSDSYDVFRNIFIIINSLPDPQEREDAIEAARRLEAEILKGDKAAENRVQRLLSFLLDALGERWEQVVEMLISTKNPYSVLRDLSAKEKNERFE